MLLEASQPSRSTGQWVRVRFAINLLELGADRNRDERVTYDELDARIEEIFALIKQHYALGAPEPPARVEMQRQQIADDHMLQAELVYTFDRAVRELRVASTLDTVTSAQHVHHVRADIDDQAYQALLTPANRTVTFLIGGVTFGRVLAVLIGLAGLAALIAFRLRQHRRA
jgi:hypothetical protein